MAPGSAGGARDLATGLEGERQVSLEKVVTPYNSFFLIAGDYSSYCHQDVRIILFILHGSC